MNNYQISNRLLKARKDMQLSQQYVAEVMNLTIQDIKNIEENKRDISDSELLSFGNIYGLSITEIIEGRKSIDTTFTQYFKKNTKKEFER